MLNTNTCPYFHTTEQSYLFLYPLVLDLQTNNCPDVVVLDDTNQKMVTLHRLILFRYLF